MIRSTLLFVILVLANFGCSQYVRVCYFTNWAQYRTGDAIFLPSDIEKGLCTHIVYAFAKIDSRNLLSPYDINDFENYQKVTGLKKDDSALKVLLAVGGYIHESGDVSPFSRTVSTYSKRKNFIDHAITYLRRNNFDGLDLDWEYPTQRGNSPPQDRLLFTTFCRELKEAFVDEQAESGKARLLLTAAVSAGKNVVTGSYETNRLGIYLDTLHLMSYDLSGSWEGKTGHHTANEAENEHSVAAGLDAWIDHGFPANKIALGFGNYGRSYTLKSASNNALEAPTTGPGAMGPSTEEAGFMSYYEICDKIKNGMTVVRDDTAQAPYGYQGTFWVGYDDEESMREKVRTFIKEMGLKGAMFWAIDLDDFTGTHCGNGKYPLMNAVKNELAKEYVATEAPKTEPTATKAQGTTDDCFGIHAWYGDNNMDQWCKSNCAVGNCPNTHCSCDPNWKPNDECYAVGAYAGQDNVDKWCNDNCPIGNCPSTHCSCD